MKRRQDAEPRRIQGRRGAAATIGFCLLAAALPAAAQTADTKGGEGTLASWMRVAEGAWGEAVGGAGWVWSATAGAFLPAAPAAYLPDQWGDAEAGFLALMDAAGYRLAAMETGGMILAHVRYRFIQERRLTDGDRDRARRAIAAHRERLWGFGPSVHRWIAESVIEAGLAPDYRVAEVEVTTRPLPNLNFRVVALDRPLDDTERRVVRELQPEPTGPAR